ncbi:hevamine-A isoform X2 [Arachis duranensis]|uniref:Acidic endochitinase n=1 Tax=Arachis duranensis TaxID=130453 RepID=A0A6P4C3R5_ARADU|nr:hevamine-A isoform X2 [Arachis duranensis]
MASNKSSSTHQALALLLFFLLTLSSAHAKGGIAIYWGQNNGDGTLTSTCDTGNFEIVILAFLYTFGCGRTPDWNFAGHCGPWSPCDKLEPEIKHCQSNGVKVFLSLGGAVGPYSLCSPDDARNVSDYLYKNFLTGQKGPLGSVYLDGIDFDIEGGGVNLYWDDLARELDARRKQDRYFYLSAAPQCFFTDYYLDTAIRTWLFDYIFVQFYNNPPCQYSNGDASLLLSSWNTWTSYVKLNNTVFMGLPAAPDAAPSGGYISPQDLCTKVLPTIKHTPNYGGVMLWDRYRDITNHYGDQIKDCVEVDDSVRGSQTLMATLSNTVYECVSAAFNRIVPKLRPF